MHLTHKQKKEMRYWQWKLTSLAGTKAKLFSTCAFKKPNFYVWNALFWSQHTSTQKFKTQVYEQMPHKISKKYICLLKKHMLDQKLTKYDQTYQRLKVWLKVCTQVSLQVSLKALKLSVQTFTATIESSNVNFQSQFFSVFIT